MTFDDVVNKVDSSKGPILRGTRAEATRMHDDKSLYVHDTETSPHGTMIASHTPLKHRHWRPAYLKIGRCRFSLSEHTQVLGYKRKWRTH